MASKPPAGIVEIHGRKYKTVAFRVNKFRAKFPDHTIRTGIVSDGDLVVAQAKIKDEAGRVIATGHAEENRAVGINKTSAIENAETSAVGRALAFMGFAGTEIASAEEIQAAKQGQSIADHLAYMDLVRDNFDSIAEVKRFIAQALADNDPQKIDAAKEVYKEIDTEIQMALWRAPTKGGIFTTLERKTLKEGL